MAEHIALRFDWEDICHQNIEAVLGLNGDKMDDAAARWEAVAICVQSATVILTVEHDTDQIIVSLGEIPSDCGWRPIANFDFVKSKPLGWCWISTNYRGYKDSLTLAFGDEVPDALTPRCMFLAEGSSLHCFDLQKHIA